MEQLLLERFPTDGKETQIILDQLNFQHLRMPLRLKQDHQLLPKLKSIQMVQLALFHKKLMNNMKEFHNSRSHLTLETPKSLMTSKIGTTQIERVFQEFYPMLKLIQMRPSEVLVTITKMPTMLTSLEIQNLLKISMVKLLLEKYPTDGKETQITLDQLSFQLPKTPLKIKPDHQLLLKKKPIQTPPSEPPVTATKQTTTPIFQEINLFLMHTTVMLL
jgi:hypothetical protein